jgi:hypothetical protein
MIWLLAPFFVNQNINFLEQGYLTSIGIWLDDDALDYACKKFGDNHILNDVNPFCLTPTFFGAH